jgi:hypothetical protein
MDYKPDEQGQSVLLAAGTGQAQHKKHIEKKAYVFAVI